MTGQSDKHYQRQILFGTQDIGHSKALRAAERLTLLNDEMEINSLDIIFIHEK